MAEPPIAPGTELAGYRIERFLAQGGMGEVYEATQLSLQRRVALKLIASDLSLEPQFRDRFRREARAAAAIDHMNILPVYETGELPGGRLFLASRFVDGQDLNSYIVQHGPLPVPLALDLLTQIADAIDAAHAKGFIHRDVKPENVLLEAHEDRIRAYLTDFGLAKPATPGSSVGHTVPGQILGTIDYMPPEQVEGLDVDQRADVYAFGCVAYRCLTGSVPYPRDSDAAKLYAHTHAPVPLPSAQIRGIPRALDVLVQRAMEKDRKRRAESAGGLMRWAVGQIQSTAKTQRPSATVVADGGGARPSRLSLRAWAILHVAVYAPLFAGAYLIGRGI